MPVFLAVISAIVALALYAMHPGLAALGFGVACGILFARQSAQQQTIRQLQATLQQQTATGALPGETIAGEAAAQTSPAGPPAASLSPPPATSTVPRSVTPVAASATASTAVPAMPAGARPEPPTAPRSRAAPSSPVESGSLPGPLRWLLAGNPVAKIGVLLLFFGLAYLFKYASERDLLPIEFRLGGAVLLAGGLLVTGWRLRLRQALYGLLLQGAAVGCLYLIIFAAYRLYQLLPQPLAFGLMLVVCAASVMLAVLQQAQGLAMAASLGGFLAPLLLSSGHGSHIGLFSYYLLLSGGILAVSLFQSWRSLNVIGFFFTFSVGGAWGLKNYVPALYAECQLFLLAFLLIYGVIALLFAFRQPTQLRGFVDGTLVFGSPLVGFGLQYGLTRHWEFGPAFSALGFAALYLPLALWLLKKRPEHGRLLAQAFFALGLAFVTLAIPLGLNASWTALAWVLEGAGLLWVGAQQAQRRMVWSGAALQLAAAVAWLGFLVNRPPLIAGAVSGLVLALAWLAGAALLWRAASRLRECSILSRVLLVGGLLWWMITLPWALQHPASSLSPELLSTLWLLLMAGSALLWHGAGRRLHWNELGHGAWLLWPVFLACTDGLLHPLHGWTWLGWALSVAAALWLLRRRETDTPAPLQIALHATLLWLLCGLLIAEALWRLQHTLLFVQEWASLAQLALPAALLGLIVYGTRRQRWPMLPHTLAWLVIGAAPLLALLGVGLIATNVQDGRVRELGLYLPLLNPLELAAGAALLALLAWQRQLVRSWPQLKLPPAARQGMLGALAFWWGNGMLLRLLADYSAIAWTAQALWDSRLVQTALALAWTVCAMGLMWQAAHKGWRLVWVVGAMLLAVVVAKLMLVDSASGGGLARAVAFIGVALLLLLIGYLAPLPPRSAVHPPLAGEDHV